MKIHTLPLGAYQTNTYIVENERHCVIIDPGYEPDTILEYTSRNGLAVDAILLTHGHFDHVGAVEHIVQATSCALWMSQSDWSQKPSPWISYFYPIANCDFTQVQFCEHEEQIVAAGLTFRVLETPGHTYGSVCYLCEDALFTGDTLFAGSCGRTDLPGGDPGCMAESLAFLRDLSYDGWFYPGHGPASQLSSERVTNPYLKGNV